MRCKTCGEKFKEDIGKSCPGCGNIFSDLIPNVEAKPVNVISSTKNVEVKKKVKNEVKKESISIKPKVRRYK